jgi:tape measure domain-containing protein
MSGVEIKVRSNSRSARTDLQKLEKSVSKIEQRTAAATKAFRNLAVGIGAAFTGNALAKSINTASDSLVNMENRIALVTGRGKDLDKTMNQLFKIAKQTRGDIGASADTYNRFGIALKGSGKSSEDLLKAVTSVNKAIAISGSGAESAKGALVQLGQGLAAGQLRGEELNSVLEAAPRLAQAIADEMEVPLGAIRDLAKDGKLTTEVVFNALINQAEVLSQEFETMEGTSDQAFSVMRDQISRTVAEISKAVGFTSAFTGRFNAVADYFEANRTEIVATVSGAILQLRDLTKGVTGTIGQVFEGIIPVFRGIFSIASAIIGRFVDALPRLILPMRTLSDDFAFLFDASFIKIELGFKRTMLNLGASFRGIFGKGFEGEFVRLFESKSLKEFGEALEAIGDSLDSYGRRYYNFANLLERSTKQFNNQLLLTGYYLGIVDQKAIRFRSKSFESFSRTLRVVNALLDRLYKNLIATEFFESFTIKIVAIKQLFARLGKAIKSSLGGPNLFSEAIQSTQKFFSGILSSAKDSLPKTWKTIEHYLNLIERKFYWVYDEVIQNSWWTDTMEQTSFLADKWLNKASDSVGKFGNSVNEKFAQVFKRFKSGASAFKDKLEISDVKIKFASVKEQFSKVSNVIKDGLAVVVKKGIEVFQNLSPGIAAAVGIGVVAGFTNYLTPSLFAKTFGRIGPIGAALLFSGFIGDFSKFLDDSGAFSALGDSLGRALGTAFSGVVAAIPYIVDGLIQGVASAGVAFGQAMEGTILGIPAKLLSIFGVGGGLITSLVYGTLGFAAFSSSFRGKVLDMLKRVVSKSSTLTSGAGILSSMFYGENFTKASEKADALMIRSANISKKKQKASVLKASKNMTDIANRARVTHLGMMGVFAAGSVALFGDILGTELSAVIGGTLGNIASQLLFTSNSMETLGSRYGKLTGSLGSGIKKLVDRARGSFKATSVSAFSSYSKISVGSKATAANHSQNFVKANATAGASFSKLGRLARVGFGAIALSTVFASVGFADTGDAAKTATASILGVIGGIATLAIMVPNLGAKLKAIGSLFKGVGKSTKGFAAGAQMASSVASNPASAAALSATGQVAASAVQGVNLGVDAAVKPKKIFKKLKEAFAGGFAGLKRILKRLALKTLGRALFTAIRTGIAAAFVGIGALITGPIVAAFAAIAVVGGLLSLAIFGPTEETIFKKLDKTMKKIKRKLNFTNDNSRVNEEKAQFTARKLGAKGDLDSKVVDALQDISFASIDDVAAGEINDTLSRLQELTDRGNQEIRTTGRITEKTAADIVRAQEAATAAIKLGQGAGAENMQAAREDTAAYLTDFFKAAEAEGGVAGFFRDGASILKDRNSYASSKGDKFLQDMAETISSADFGKDEFEFKTFLDAFVKFTNTEEGRSEATERRGVANIARGYFREQDLDLIGQVNAMVQANSGATEDGFYTGPGISQALKDAFNLYIQEISTNQGDLDQIQLIAQRQNLEEALRLEKEEFTYRRKRFNDALIGSAFFNNDIADTLFNRASLSAPEQTSIANKQLQIQKSDSEISELQAIANASQGTAAGPARAALADELVKKSQLETQLSELVQRAMSTGVSMLDRSQIATNLEMSGLGPAISETMSKAMTNFDPNPHMHPGKMPLMNMGAKPGVKAVGDGITELTDEYRELDSVIAKLNDKMQLDSAPTQFDQRQLQESIDRQKQITKELEIQGQLTELLYVESSEVSGLVAQAAALSDLKDLDMDNLYKLDPTTSMNIAELAATFMALKLAASDPAIAEGAGLTFEEILAKSAETVAAIKSMFGENAGVLRGKPSGGGSSETMFEKFVGGLNASGFSMDIEQAAGLAGSAIKGLEGPLKAIKDAQERIKKASLGDNEARRASLAIIETQREAIAGILTSGTVEQASIGLESLGIDASQATSQESLDALMRISKLQDTLNDTLFTDFETRKAISREIERQTRLQEGLTTGAQASTDAIKGSIKESFSGLLKGTMSFKEAMHNVLDSISSQIIDTVVGSFVDAMFEASGLQDMFDGLFAGLFSSGDKLGGQLGENIGGAITDGIGSSANGSGGLFSTLAEGFSGLLSGLGEGLKNAFSGLGGGGGGGGFWSSLLGIFGGMGGGGAAPVPLGLSQGGTVPNTPFSQAGKDSVPAMLMPGEVVLSKNAVRNQSLNSSQQQQVFNINVSGDVSRQTRSEIVKMMPQIASGVNMNNKENNFRR